MVCFACLYTSQALPARHNALLTSTAPYIVQAGAAVFLWACARAFLWALLCPFVRKMWLTIWNKSICVV